MMNDDFRGQQKYFIYQINNEADVAHEMNAPRMEKYAVIKIAVIGLFCLVGLIVMMKMGSGLCDNVKEAVKKNQSGISAGGAGDYQGMSFKEAAVILEAKGFQNIVLNQLDDTNILTRRKKGRVKSICIGGKTDFHMWNKFDPEDKVVITYH